ncbi:MAG: hypothetical protein AAGA56_08385 [Myxococcota bacterium]
MNFSLPWSGRVDVVDPFVGIPVELHLEGSFEGELTPDHRGWLEGQLLALVPEAVAKSKLSLRELSTDALRDALAELLDPQLEAKHATGELRVAKAFVSSEGLARLEAAHAARASGFDPDAEEDPWASTMLSAASDIMSQVEDLRRERAPTVGIEESAPAPVDVPCMVTWSNGEQYPGTIRERKAGKLLIEMLDGKQHWIARAYVSES